MRQFGSLLTAMVTPFRADGALDLPQARALAARLVSSGSDGIVVSGTTGEAPTLDHAERGALLEAVIAEVGDRARVIAGTGSYDTRQAIELSRAAEAAGAHGLLLIAPYYNRPNQAGLIAHFSAIAEATHLPIMLYNHPGRTGVSIEAATAAELARRYPTIQAVKDSSGSLEVASEYLRLAPEGFALYCGDDPLTLPYLSVGASGLVSVASHLVGPEIRTMIEAFHRGEHAKAQALHRSLFPLFKALFLAPSPAPTKHALARAGFPVGGMRLPLVPMTEAEGSQVDRAIEPWLAVRP